MTELDKIRRLVRQVSIDPWSFFGSDPDAKWREYALQLHPDRAENGDGEIRKQWFTRLSELRDLAKQPIARVGDYELRGKLGRGDLCDVYYAVGHSEMTSTVVVKVPYIKSKSVNYLLAKEWEVLNELADTAKGTTYYHYFPIPLETFESDGKRHIVTSWRDELYTAEEIHERHEALQPRHLAWMLRRILVALGFAHRHGWANCACLPPHLAFSIPDHGLSLLGWTHAEKIGKPIKVVPAKWKAEYPTCSKTASVGLDLWLAARSILFMSGDGMASSPMAFRHFVRSLVLPSANLWPDDAWAVHDQLTDVLDHVYGPPQFVELEM